MLIFFLGCYTIWLWAMLPMFHRYMLPPSSGLNCIGLWVAVYVFIYIILFWKGMVEGGMVCRNLPSPHCDLPTTLPTVKVKQWFLWWTLGWQPKNISCCGFHWCIIFLALKRAVCTPVPGPLFLLTQMHQFTHYPALHHSSQNSSAMYMHSNSSAYTLWPWRWRQHIPLKHQDCLHTTTCVTALEKN
jgi:hypothetical protein